MQRIILAGLAGLALGWSFLAYAQVAPPTAAADGVAGEAFAGLAYLVQSFGLPGVLAWLGWLLGRHGGVPVRVVVDLDPETRRVLAAARAPEDR